MKRLIPFSLIAAFAASTAFAGGDHAKKFEEMDADKSGTIERTELQSHPKAIDQFTDADENGNGVLEKAEFAELEFDEDESSSHSDDTSDSSSSDNDY